MPVHKRERINIASIFNCKSKPSTLGHHDKEFQPSVPCETCFPKSNQQVEVLEDLGVRDLLNLSLAEDKNMKLRSLQKTLGTALRSIQAHWGQLEYMANMSCSKIFVAIHHTPLDKLLIQVCIEAIPESRRLLVIDANNSHQVFSFLEKNPRSNALIFFGKEDDVLITIFNLIHEFRENDLDEEEARISFISQAYDFFGDRGKLNQPIDMKPDARINFSYCYFISDFLSLMEKNRAVDISSHLRHEIWKNTPVMMSHVVGFLCRYQKYSKETSFEKWTLRIQSVRDMLRLNFDMVGVGDLEEITLQSQGFLESPQVSSYFPSALLHSVMYQAIMVKAILACIDETDCHAESHELNKDAALENFRTLTRILQNNLSFIHPPCVDTASIESKTFNYFIAHGILSENSDQIVTEERRIARNMSRHLDLASDDEEEDMMDLPPKESKIYIDIQNLDSIKWMVSMVDELLEIYLSVAQTIYEIRHVDVIELSIFLERVTCQYADSFAKQWNERFTEVAVSSLKLFEKEGIIERYLHSSDVAIVYCLLPFQEERLLLLIHQMSQFF